MGFKVTTLPFFFPALAGFVIRLLAGAALYEVFESKSKLVKLASSVAFALCLALFWWIGSRYVLSEDAAWRQKPYQASDSRNV